jgi:hypothetical protein
MNSWLLASCFARKTLASHGTGYRLLIPGLTDQLINWLLVASLLPVASFDVQSGLKNLQSSGRY